MFLLMLAFSGSPPKINYFIAVSLILLKGKLAVTVVIAMGSIKMKLA